MEKIPPPYYLCLCLRSVQSVKLSPSLAALLKEQMMWKIYSNNHEGIERSQKYGLGCGSCFLKAFVFVLLRPCSTLKE